jgi:hypothetical protein
MAGEIISERRARSNRNAGRDHRGFAGDFPRNPHDSAGTVAIVGFRGGDDNKFAHHGYHWHLSCDCHLAAPKLVRLRPSRRISPVVVRPIGPHLPVTPARVAPAAGRRKSGCPRTAAASANCKVTQRPWLMTLAPILISFPRKIFRDHGSTATGNRLRRAGSSSDHNRPVLALPLLGATAPACRRDARTVTITSPASTSVRWGKGCRRGADPTRRCRTLQVESLAGVDLGLAIERLCLILADFMSGPPQLGESRRQVNHLF